jgi:hypothetical protein
VRKRVDYASLVDRLPPADDPIRTRRRQERLRVQGEHVAEHAQVVAQPSVVGVEERDHLAPREPDSGVAGDGRSAMALPVIADEPALDETGQRLRGPVR